MTALRRRRFSLLVTTAITATLAIGAASAHAEAPIEGIWSFNGGKVGIQAQADGTFAGTVVAPTKFADCEHPVGELMWTGMTAQPDGSYWGLHQWLYPPSRGCAPTPNRGLTAWRVLNGSGGSRFLRVCFSEPGSKSQPTIAPDGSTAGATYGCADSALIAPLPEVTPAKFDRYVKLPPNKTCFARSKMRIRLHDPKNDPLVKIVVKLRSGKIVRTAKLKRRRGVVIATLDLRGLAAGSFTVTVRLATALGEHLSGKRTYHRCGAGKRHRPRLHRH